MCLQYCTLVYIEFTRTNIVCMSKLIFTEQSRQFRLCKSEGSLAQHCDVFFFDHKLSDWLKTIVVTNGFWWAWMNSSGPVVLWCISIWYPPNVNLYSKAMVMCGLTLGWSLAQVPSLPDKSNGLDKMLKMFCHATWRTYFQSFLPTTKPHFYSPCVFSRYHAEEADNWYTSCEGLTLDCMSNSKSQIDFCCVYHSFPPE